MTRSRDTSGKGVKAIKSRLEAQLRFLCDGRPAARIRERLKSCALFCADRLPQGRLPRRLWLGFEEYLKARLKGRANAFLERTRAGRRIMRRREDLRVRLKAVRTALREQWRSSRLKARVENCCPLVLRPVVLRGLGLGAVGLCLVLVMSTRASDLSHPGPVVLVKNPKRVQAESAGAGGKNGNFDGWYRFPVESWHLACVEPDLGSFERRGSRYGYSCVREPVGTIMSAKRVPAPLIATGEKWEIVAWVPESAAEPLDARGWPLRFGADSGAQDAHVGIERRDLKGTALSYYYVPRARGLGYKGPILRHESAVRKFARMYRLPQHLIFAVMQVESGGRQELVSHKDARGLMQVQPATAGSEVASYLARRSGNGEPTIHDVHAALADTDQNILYGASYLHILDKVYFKKVTDRESRLLCVLAAYNMGPGRLLRLFGDTPEESVAQINSYTPMGLYEEIKARFEDVSDYDYMDKVITLMLQYRKMGY